MKLVDCVLQVEAAQERVRSDLSRAQDVAPAVGLDLGEGEKLPDAAVEIAPHPAVKRSHQPVNRCSKLKRHLSVTYVSRSADVLIGNARLGMPIKRERISLAAPVQRQTRDHVGAEEFAETSPEGRPVRVMRYDDRRARESTGAPRVSQMGLGEHWRPTQGIAGILITSIGVALMASALAANQRWLDRHFLPSFFIPRHSYVLIETCVRFALGTLGLALVACARSATARLNARTATHAIYAALAGVLALGASELALRRVHLRPVGWLVPEEEPRRQSDPRLGWTLVPSRTGHSAMGGRVIEYAIDAAGYRVRRVEEPVDPERPTIVFVGESVMFGEGLTYDESVPARVGAMRNAQSANLAVHGFSVDQAYLRLEAELPRFRRPVAVVSLFMTALFGRNLDDDRPHLGPGLVRLPAEQHGRLISLAGLLVPYRRDETVEGGIAMTRDVLRATVELARARGATPLIVVPQVEREEPPDATLRRRILDEAGVPYVLVPLDPTWHLPWDRHPDARGARAIAEAVAARLVQR
jgi:hypothetical protein